MAQRVRATIVAGLVAMATLGVLGLGVLWIGAAAAEDFQDTDCAKTDFHFNGSGYNVSCRHLKQAGSNQVTEDDNEIYVHDEAETLYIDVLEVHVVNGYQDRVSMLGDLRNSYGENFDHEWHETGKHDGYEMAEYEGEDDGGSPIDCIAFRRYVNFNWGGVSRFLVGHGCTTKTRDGLYALLKQLAAPGD